MRATDAAAQSIDAAERARACARRFAPVAHLRGVRRADPARLGRLVAGAERLDETLRVAAAAAGRLEAPLAERPGGSPRSCAGSPPASRSFVASVSEIDARALAAERRAGGRRAEPGGEAARASARGRGSVRARRRGGDDGRGRRGARAESGPRARRRRSGARAPARTSSCSSGCVDGAARLEAALAVEIEHFEAPVRARAEAQATRTTELGADLRRLGAEEVELRQAASAAGEKLAAIDVELARTDAERDEAQRRLEAAGAEPAEGEDRDELAEKLDALREAARAARPGQPAREGGVRRGEGAARGALGAARRSREEPRGAREAPRRLDAHRRDALRRDVRRRRASLPRGRGHALPRRRGTPAHDRARGRGRGARDRGRAAPGRQEGHAALAPLGRREGARRDRVPVLAVPRAAEPVLPPRRGRGRARRHEHRPLHRAPADVRRPRAVHRDHAPEAHDGGGGRPLRRDDGERRRLADRLAAAAARRRGRATRERPRLAARRVAAGYVRGWRGAGAQLLGRLRCAGRDARRSSAGSSAVCASRSASRAARSPSSCRSQRSTRRTTRRGSGSRRR